MAETSSALGGTRESGRLFTILGRYRPLIQGAIDVVVWTAALLAALSIRHDFSIAWTDVRGLLRLLPLVVVTHLVIGAYLGLYRGRWRFGSFEEVLAVAQAAVLAGLTVSLINIHYLGRLVPASVPFAASLAALVGMAGARYVWRLVLDRRRRPKREAAEPLIVYGAGEAGAQIVTSLLRDPDSPYYPVALIDDDRSKANLQILGVPVVGTGSDLVHVATREEATTVLLAVPSADAELVRRVTQQCTQAALELHVLPTRKELLGARVDASNMRRPTEADLLGRREIDTDIDSIASYVTGKRVLVTGAGGSIGSELCRQLARFGPGDLVLLDRDESALHGVQLSIEGRALLDQPNTIVADIRDRARMREVFAEWRPQVVFHAAALKHLPLLEMHADEGVKTNVYATQHLLDVAVAHDVERFVNISTDKAAAPSSVLGYTKRIAERLTAHAAGRASGRTYLSVRFGNVLGSRGSMLTTFQAQIAAGGPLTVTDPEITRFFMTIEEAVQLVIQAGAIGRSGEVLVLDMGSPVRIADVARQLAALSDRPIEIVYTGVRPGEKLHEVLLGEGEVDERPFHPMISHVVVPPLGPERLRDIASACSASLRSVLESTCTAEAHATSEIARTHR
jgi:FlaA1/EpsC-like NDP-sugar epimerase